MRQILFEAPFFHFPVPGFGLMLVIAFLSSIHLARWRATRVNLDPELIYDLAIWVLLGGLLGARTFYVIQYARRIDSFWEIFQVWKGGIVLYGSIIGGAVAFFAYHRLRPFPIRPMMDVVAPSLAMGIAFGRIGCFLNGCCFGDPCDLPWALSFPKESPPWGSQVSAGLIETTAARSLPVHPTQLYSAIDGFILCLLLSAYYFRRRRDGEVMGLLMVFYPITRFLIELLRYDEAAVFLGMTISQTISVLLLIAAVPYWVILNKQPKTLHADAA